MVGCAARTRGRAEGVGTLYRLVSVRSGNSYLSIKTPDPFPAVYCTSVSYFVKRGLKGAKNSPAKRPKHVTPAARTPRGHPFVVSSLAGPPESASHRVGGGKSGMSIEFACGECGKKYAVKNELAGKTAKCQCGARIQIPTLSPAKLSAPAPREDPAETIQKLYWTATGNRTLWRLGKRLEGTGSALVKIAIGGAVGGIVGIWALAREHDGPPLDPNFRMLMVFGAAVAGAFAAGLLSLVDVVRTRRAEGRPAPALLCWYFGNGLWSVLLWIVTVIVGVLVFAVIDVSRL